MDRDEWDVRYGSADLLWSAEPNRFLVEEVEDLPPGRVLDVACGEGRNAIWLAARGWQATGLDFSPVALEKGRRVAAGRDVDVTWVEADLADWAPAAGAFDLVIIFYLHLPAALRRRVHRRMATGLAAGGTILVVGHAAQNLVDGHGGPQDPSVLYSPEDVVADLEGLRIVKAEQVRRAVQTDDGEKQAIDVLVRAVRP